MRNHLLRTRANTRGAAGWRRALDQVLALDPAGARIRGRGMSTRRTPKTTSRPATKTTRPIGATTRTAGAATPRPRPAPRPVTRVETAPRQRTASSSSRLVRRRQVAGDACAGRPRLFCVRQPSDHAAADLRRADDAGRQRRSRRRRGHRRREGALLEQFPRVFRDTAEMPGLNPDADLPRGQRSGAGAALQRDAPAASAGPASIRARGRPRGTGPADAVRRSPPRSSTPPTERARAARGLHGPSLGTARSAGDVGDVPQLRVKYGLPLDADLVFDVRFLPTRISSPACAERTGRDRPSCSFLDRFEDTGIFLAKVTDLRQFRFRATPREGKSYLTVAIGCTGGRHRSVAMSRALAKAAEGSHRRPPARPPPGRANA